MTRAQAKRLACRISSGLVQRWIESDWACSTAEVPTEDNERLEEAMHQLADELHRRSERLEWPPWWDGTDAGGNRREEE